MHIEIKGTNLINKGAELMLLAILQKVRGTLPEASLVMPPRYENYLERAKLQLWQKLWLDKYGVQWGSLGKVVPKKLRRRYGLILDNEIDVVLDASGFRYSDQFGDKSTLDMASYVNAWKRRGTKVILLPQAMGPFSSRPIRKAFASIVENADIVFPRDDVSYKHVTDLVGKRANVIQSPDFTNLVAGTPPRDPDRFQGRFCLVPNYQMIARTSAEDSALYTAFCAKCIKCLIDLGHKPFILIHEGDIDVELAKKIIDEVGQEIQIIEETDALRIKGILGLCAGVISSRFHALVSCLSQGTPVLATGWSHKYEMLLNEYGIPDGCLSVSKDSVALNKQIEGIVKNDSRKRIIAEITKASTMYKGQTEQMWEKVFALIAAHNKWEREVIS